MKVFSLSPEIKELVINEAVETFFHSSGPGGQNANKVETGVRLVWDVAESQMLPEAILEHLLVQPQVKNGKLTVECQTHRTQVGNRGEARTLFLARLDEALEVPKPRKKTKKTRTSQQRRLEGKKLRSQTKQGRQKVSW